MTNYCNSCGDKNNDYKHDCCIESSSECDKYKEKSDELYVKAHHVQEESKRLICEARELDDQAKELERKARELCARANMTWDNARKLESESTNLLDLASFYSCKASECYKNMGNANQYKPTCTLGYGGGCSKKC